MAMSASLEHRVARRGGRLAVVRVAWLIAFAATAYLWLYGPDIAPWAMIWPRALEIPVMAWISAAMKWLIEDATFGLFTFTDLTRGIAWLVQVPYRAALSLLSTGFLRGEGSNAVMLLPPLSGIAVIVIAVLLALRAGDRRLAILVGACFLYLAVFGQWRSAMVTLASILIAFPFGVVGGLLLGLAGARWPLFERAIRPVLDLMQTVPIFAYLVPILILFGFGPTSAVVATMDETGPKPNRIRIGTR